MSTHPATKATVEGARSLRGLIDGASDQMERDGLLAEEVVVALMEGGLFGILTPEAVGCSECDPLTAIDIVSEVSYADGATGWVLETTSVSTALAGAYLGEGAAREVFSSPRYLCAGSAVPPGTAERVAGGYRIEGRFTFGSGTNHAGWILGEYAVEQDGKPVLGTDGEPTFIYAIVPASNVELFGNWDVMGLVATGSQDYKVPAQIVSDEWTFRASPRVDPDPLRGGALYRMGPFSLSALAHGSFPLGVARRALDEFLLLVRTKKRPMAARATLQRDFAQASARVASARAFMRDSFSRLYDAALEGQITREHRAEAHLAASHAVHTCAEAVRFVYLASGTTAFRNGGRIQRCFRDAHGATQHVGTGEGVLLEYGALLLEAQA
jgi:alkylation response protein AidB-like acyl-CoA dehydrogenase